MGCRISSLARNITSHVRRPRNRKQLSTEVKDGKLTDETSNENTTMGSTHSRDIPTVTQQVPQDLAAGHDPEILDWGYGYGDTLIEAMEHPEGFLGGITLEQIEPPPPQALPPPPRAPKVCVTCTKFLTPKDDTPLDCYSCPGCSSPYCITCLKSMFLSACKDQSRMPPRCCRVIQLSVVLPHLSDQEIALYRSKYEEWSTPNPLYCPVPSCSAFIPPRLLPILPKSVPKEDPEGSDDKDSLLDRVPRLAGTPEIISTDGIASDAQALRNLALPEPIDGVIVDTEASAANVVGTCSNPGEPILSCTDTEEKGQKPSATQAPDPVNLPTLPSVSCPQCDVNICLGCKQVDHPGMLCPPELDPLMTKLLKKWKIKRCPRCHAGVKRMFGCSHMRCHCGAQWCWNCLEPIQICNQDCAGQEEPEESAVEDGDDVALEDLDEAIVMDDQVARENYDFGEEPNQDDLVPWNCSHYWIRSIEQQREQLECQQCWKMIFSEKDEKRLGVTISKEMGAWVCECGMMVCGACAGKVES
ncbi:MAG: hypothetical protein M1812_004520 [Candelaria pacifica]|nr:MAG: hypothetical protein M1812_004520 [Candelaria pacifica]